MRVSSRSFYHQFSDQVRTLANRQNRLQTQAASGQRIQTADEDPAAMRRILDLQAEATRVQQHQKNIDGLKEKVSVSYDVLRGLKTLSDRVTELAVLADGTKSPDDLKLYATEVGQLLEQATTLVNSRYNGEYLFAGTRSDREPFKIQRNAEGRITDVTYQGNADAAAVEVAEGMVVSVLVPGENPSGTGSRGLVSDPRSGADFFRHLIQFQNNLLAGDVDAIITQDRAALAKDEENIIVQMSTNGATQSRLESARSIATSRVAALGNLISREGNADLAETLVQLNQTQTAYQAALQSGAGVMRLSLLNYLR
jgi:flagellar hook-associated protein 3 FlgL